MQRAGGGGVSPENAGETSSLTLSRKGAGRITHLLEFPGASQEIQSGGSCPKSHFGNV